MPVVTFTARFVESLAPPSSGQCDYWDRALPGFGLRLSFGGRKAWVVRYRTSSRLRRLTLGPYPTIGLADARDRARTALLQAASGQDPAAVKRATRNAETFGDLAVEYLARHAKVKKRTWREDERTLKVELLPSWKHTPLKELKRRDIRELIQRIAERPAPIMANRTLAIVRKMLNFAIESDWLEANPAALIPKPGVERARDRVLTSDELRAFWAATDQESTVIRAWLRLRLLTAQRGGEVIQMRWSDVDLEDKWWTIPAGLAKNKLAHRVPLSPPALAILRELRSKAGPNDAWVCSPSGLDTPAIHNAKKAVARMRRRLGFDFRGHDLRRTAASLMTSSGTPRLVVGKILNHVETGVTAVYDRHSYDKEKREALDAWAKQLQRILRRRKTGKVLAFARAATDERAKVDERARDMIAARV
jgi:integrase